MSWVVVVPVKGGTGAKSRLAGLPGRARLARSFALDTVAALLGASVVSEVLVVTADRRVATDLAAIGASIEPELSEMARADAGAAPSATDPLNAAIMQGIERARALHPDAHLAVFTGDLPALTVADVEAALALATVHDRSMVPDEEGDGTTVLLALAGVPLVPQFGNGSRAAHEAAGHFPLAFPPTSSIRRDVDTAANLTEAVTLGVGPNTAREISVVAPKIEF